MLNIYTQHDEFVGEPEGGLKINDYADSMENDVNHLPVLNFWESYSPNYGAAGKYANTVKYQNNPDTRLMTMYVYNDDPIVKIVPKYLFQQINTGFVHIGKEYGFFMKTEALENGVLLSNVFLFDLINEIDDPNLMDSIRFDIQPLFQREYVYLTSDMNYVNTRTVSVSIDNPQVANNLEQIISTKVEAANSVVPLPYVLGMDLYRFTESGRYYMTDIANTVNIYNEQHLNEGDVG